MRAGMIEALILIAREIILLVMTSMIAGIRLMARMIGMIGVIILIAMEIILMTRMIAQM